MLLFFGSTCLWTQKCIFKINILVAKNILPNTTKPIKHREKEEGEYNNLLKEKFTLML
jgi:hypothetical protein